MDRRETIVALVIVPVAPLLSGEACAQQTGPVVRIGWLNPAALPPRETFREALRELGTLKAGTSPSRRVLPRATSTNSQTSLFNWSG